MTDRINGFYVTLEKNIREDDVRPLMDAMKHMKGVMTVEPQVSDWAEHIAYERVRRELGSELLDVLYPERKESG